MSDQWITLCISKAYAMGVASEVSKTLVDIGTPDTTLRNPSEAPPDPSDDGLVTLAAAPVGHVAPGRSRMPRGTGRGPAEATDDTGHDTERSAAPPRWDLHGGEDEAKTVVEIEPAFQPEQPGDPMAAPSQTLLNDVGAMLAVLRAHEKPAETIGYEHVRHIVAVGAAAVQPKLGDRIGDYVRDLGMRIWRPTSWFLGGLLTSLRLLLVSSTTKRRCCVCNNPLGQFECKLAIPAGNRRDVYVRAFGKDWAFFHALGVASPPQDHLALYLAHCGECGNDSRLQIVERRGLRSYLSVDNLRLSSHDVFALFSMTDPS